MELYLLWWSYIQQVFRKIHVFSRKFSSKIVSTYAASKHVIFTIMPSNSNTIDSGMV